MVKDHSDSERGRKEGNVLFNDALNTFYLRLYGVGHMVKDHSDSERGRKEGNVLFNDALNTFYLPLYGVGHMVKDHSDSERGRKEGNDLFNDALNTFYLRLYGVGHMVSDHSDSERGRKEMCYLTTHSTPFIYGYMASDIWLRTILIVRKETCCHHIGYCFRLTARVLLYAPSHRQDNTYHSLCYTSRGALAGTGNSSMGPPHEGSI